MTIAKAGIFSGINNLDIYNIIDPKASDKFGFTHDEVQELLAEQVIYGIHQSQQKPSG